MSNLPSYTNAVALLETGIDIYNAGGVVNFVCNETFAVIEAFLGCTCIDDSTGAGASWDCIPAVNENANVEVCQPSKYKTSVASRLFVYPRDSICGLKNVKQLNYLF